MGSTGRGWRPTDISALSFILRIGVLGLQVLARARGGSGVGSHMRQLFARTPESRVGYATSTTTARPATTCSLQGQRPGAPRRSPVQAAAGERGCSPSRAGHAVGVYSPATGALGLTEETRT